MHHFIGSLKWNWSGNRSFLLYCNKMWQIIVKGKVMWTWFYPSWILRCGRCTKNQMPACSQLWRKQGLNYWKTSIRQIARSNLKYKYAWMNHTQQHLENRVNFHLTPTFKSNVPIMFAKSSNWMIKHWEPPDIKELEHLKRQATTLLVLKLTTHLFQFSKK